MDKNNKKTKEEKSIKVFWNKHKKKIIIAASAIGAIGITLLAIFGKKNVPLNKWVEKAPLEDLETARGNVHTEWLNPKTDDKMRETLWSIMKYLDQKIEKLKWNGETPTGPAFHRENGWYI